MKKQKSSLKSTAVPGGSRTSAGYSHPLILTLYSHPLFSPVISPQRSYLRGVLDCSVPCPSFSFTFCLVPMFNTFLTDYLCCTCIVCPLSWDGSSMRTGARPQHSARARHDARTLCISSRHSCWLRQLQRWANSHLCTSVLTLLFSCWLPLHLMRTHIWNFSRHVQLRPLSAQALISSPLVYDSLSRGSQGVVNGSPWSDVVESSLLSLQ